MSAQHIEDDIDFALEVGVDYIILDGRGGATGAAPDIFKNNISVPTIPALARACGHDRLNRFSTGDLITWKREMANLAGVPYAGVGGQWRTLEESNPQPSDP